MNRRGRPVLLPLGREWPGKDHRVFSFEELLELCGADFERVIAASSGMKPEEFIARYNAELFALEEEEVVVAIASHGGSPMNLGEILAARAWLESEVNLLARALWTLFINEEAEYWLMTQLSRQGTYDTDPKSLGEPPPFWTLSRYQEQKFLVVLTRACNAEAITDRVEDYFSLRRFKDASPHPPTIPAPSDPPNGTYRLQIPRSPRTPSLTGLKLKGTKNDG